MGSQVVGPDSLQKVLTPFLTDGYAMAMFSSRTSGSDDATVVVVLDGILVIVFDEGCIRVSSRMRVKVVLTHSLQNELTLLLAK